MNNNNELFNTRINSSLNDSTTKQAYSFGREKRFKNTTKKDNLYHFYDLPQIRSNRCTSLGYGKRLNSSAIIGCGSNKLYAPPNYFDPKNHNSPGYTFGVSRRTKKRQERSPGPIYDVSKKFGDNVPGYVFGTSGMKKKRMQRASSSIPGALQTFPQAPRQHWYLPGHSPCQPQPGRAAQIPRPTLSGR